MFSVVKYFPIIFSIAALIAFVPARVAADDGESAEDWQRHHPYPPPPPPQTQVLWGQCGGYYYTGTKVCPEGAYCRYFSDWYSQCNLNGQ